MEVDFSYVMLFKMPTNVSIFTFNVRLIHNILKRKMVIIESAFTNA